MRQVTQCPVCDSSLKITELSCVHCETRLHGSFPPAPLGRLSNEHQQFVETFVRCRGIIRDVERALGISYPTVRARLDSVVVALEAAVAADRPDPKPAPEASLPLASDKRRRELLRQVEAGEIDVEDAVQALNNLK